MRDGEADRDDIANGRGSVVVLDSGSVVVVSATVVVAPADVDVPAEGRVLPVDDVTVDAVVVGTVTGRAGNDTGTVVSTGGNVVGGLAVADDDGRAPLPRPAAPLATARVEAGPEPRTEPTAVVVGAERKLPRTAGGTLDADGTDGAMAFAEPSRHFSIAFRGVVVSSSRPVIDDRRIPDACTQPVTWAWNASKGRIVGGEARSGVPAAL